MEDFYFNFKTEKLWIAESKKAGIIDKKKEPLPHEYNIDVVGLIVNKPAVIDMTDIENIKVISDATFIDGWHVNIRGKYPENFEPYKINKPNRPIRVFAGE